MSIEVVRKAVRIAILLVFAMFCVYLFIDKWGIARIIFPAFSGVGGWILLLTPILLAFLVVRLGARLRSTFAQIPNGLAIGILLAITIVPRVLWILIVDVAPQSDFLTYFSIASLLAQGNDIGGEYVSLFPHTIGYPSILAGVFKLLGIHVQAAQWFSIFLSCGISILIWELGNRWFAPPVGFLAGVMWALWPSQIFYTSLVSTEYLFTCLMLLTLSMYTRIVTSKTRTLRLGIGMCIVGISCACIQAIRPIGVILLLAFAIYVLIFSSWLSSSPSHLKKKLVQFIPLSRNGQMRIIFLVTMLIGYIITSASISAWISQSIHQDIAKRPFGFNLYVGLNTATHGTWNEPDALTLDRLRHQSNISAQSVHDQLAQLAYQRYLEASLAELVNLVIHKMQIMWSTDHESLSYILAGFRPQDSLLSVQDFSSFAQRLAIVANLYYFVMQVWMVLAVMFLWKSRAHDMTLIPMLVICGIVAIHLLVEVQSRYHFPVIAIGAIFASYGFTQMAKQGICRKKSQQIA